MTLELAVLFPALLLLIFTVVQAALWYHARSLALGAAQEGARAGRAEGSTPAAGVRTAERFLADQAGDSLAHTTVSSAGSSPTQIRIEMSGRALSVLPGVPGMTVTQQAHGTRERFTTAGQP